MRTVVAHNTYFPRVPVFMAGPFFSLYMTYFKIAESKLKISQAGDPVIGKPAYSLRHEMMSMKRIVFLAIITLILVSCKNTRPPVVTYECTDDFEIREEPERTIILRDTIYYFWSIRDCGTGEIKCFISVKRNKNFKELYDM